MGRFFRATSGVIAAMVAAGALACGSSSGTMSNGDAGAEGAATSVVGEIFLQQVKSPGTTLYDLNARFETQTADVCTRTTTGACVVATCPTPGGTSGSAPTQFNAGPITVSAPAGSATLTFTGSGSIGHYTQISGSSAFFAGGDAITASGAGGADLPAFPTQTIVAPNDITVTAPVCAPACPALDRTTDLVVTWTGGGAGTVQIQLETGTTTSSVDIACTFDASAGTGTVPAALLAQLAGPSSMAGFAVTLSNQATFEVGTASTTMTVEGTGLIAPPLTISK